MRPTPDYFDPPGKSLAELDDVSLHPQEEMPMCLRYSQGTSFIRDGERFITTETASKRLELVLRKYGEVAHAETTGRDGRFSFFHPYQMSCLLNANENLEPIAEEGYVNRLILFMEPERDYGMEVLWLAGVPLHLEEENWRTIVEVLENRIAARLPGVSFKAFYDRLRGEILMVPTYQEKHPHPLNETVLGQLEHLRNEPVFFNNRLLFFYFQTSTRQFAVSFLQRVFKELDFSHGLSVREERARRWTDERAMEAAAHFRGRPRQEKTTIKELKADTEKARGIVKAKLRSFKNKKKEGNASPGDEEEYYSILRSPEYASGTSTTNGSPSVTRTLSSVSRTLSGKRKIDESHSNGKNGPELRSCRFTKKAKAGEKMR